MPATAKYAHDEGLKLLRSLRVRIARALRKPGLDEVHDLRVAIRRSLRVLIVLKPCFPRSESRRIRRGLKRIMAQAGAVRNCDIAMRLLAKIALPGSGAAIEEFRKQRAETAESLNASLQHWKERNLLVSWQRALESGPTAKGSEARFGAAAIETTARRILPELAAEYFRHGAEAVADTATPDEIHEFRIAAKNLRYTLDLFAPLYRGSLTGMLAQLKGVQALLGDINDCLTVRRMLRTGPDAAAHKELRAALKKRQARKIDQFRERFSAGFQGAQELREWKRSLASAPRPAEPATGKRRPS